jgi:hypothetical protein
MLALSPLRLRVEGLADGACEAWREPTAAVPGASSVGECLDRGRGARTLDSEETDCDLRCMVAGTSVECSLGVLKDPLAFQIRIIKG